MFTDCPSYIAQDIYIDKEDYQYNSVISRKEKKSKTHNLFSFISNEFLNEDVNFFEAKKNTILYTYKDFVKELPIELSYLEKSFKNSEYIIELQENWDDEGADKYEFSLWKKSIDFVVDYAKILFLDFNKKMIIPNIYHGPKGSIDILLENENNTLLINILSTGDYAEYFGKDRFNNSTKGTIYLENINRSLIPLAFSF